MDIELLISFLLASITLSLMPGPDNVFVLTESITKGKRNGIIISAGLASGIIIHTIVIATGLSILVQQSPYVFTGIKIFGAIYLLYLAYLTYKEGTNMASVSNQSSGIEKKEKWFPLYKKGFIMNVLNPKVTLFFIAFLPQFVSKNGLPFSVQIFFLGIIFMIQAFLVFSIIAIVSEKLRQYLNSSVFWTKVKWVKMAILILLAGFLLLIP
ncbi:MAG: LysE family translocator [Bacteroidales bacterium]|nr:LysE family translocator [Bacteroidales bacterium]